MNENSSFKSRIQEDMKIAMRAHEKERLNTIRFLLSKIKQREIDEQITLNNEQVLSVVEKLVKQHRDSINQYQKAGREDLVNKEEAELAILQFYLPEQLSNSEISAIIQEAIKETKASSLKDIGKVMGIVKPKIQGRTDISLVSQKIKELLS